MVLEISGKLFGQEDVRETETIDVKQENYNLNEFLIANNIVSLSTKTSYLSIPAAAFTVSEPYTKAHKIDTPAVNSIHSINIDSGTGIVMAPVQLPHNAIITACVVYGNVAFSSETWTLYRIDLNSPTSFTALATATGNTEDTSISTATVDNQSYMYMIETTVLDAIPEDQVYGARITYTTKYD